MSLPSTSNLKTTHPNISATPVDFTPSQTLNKCGTLKFSPQCLKKLLLPTLAKLQNWSPASSRSNVGRARQTEELRNGTTVPACNNCRTRNPQSFCCSHLQRSRIGVQLLPATMSSNLGKKKSFLTGTAVAANKNCRPRNLQSSCCSHSQSFRIGAQLLPATMSGNFGKQRSCATTLTVAANKNCRARNLQSSESAEILLQSSRIGVQLLPATMSSNLG